MRWLDSIIDSTDRNLSKLWKIPKDRGVWHAVVYGDQRDGYDLRTGQQHIKRIIHHAQVKFIPRMHILQNTQINQF